MNCPDVEIAQLQGRITRVTLPGGKVVEYEYDENGCRIRRLENGRPHWEYGWLDQVRLAWVRQARARNVQRGVALCFEYGETAQGQPLREPLFMTVTRDGSSETERYALVSDHLGSLRGLRDESGKLIKTWEHDSFGNLIEETGPDIYIPLGFAGGLTDPDHDFIHFGFRDYDPDCGRWTATDPLGLAGGDPDLYGYCMDDQLYTMHPMC